MVYTKEFLLNALCSRYDSVFKTAAQKQEYRNMASKHYDKVGKDRFRVAASLDAEALRKFKLAQ